MTTLRIMIIIGTCLLWQQMSAQRKIQVLDLETHLPVIGVNVRTDSVLVGKTDAQGFVVVKEPFREITFSHIEYAKEKLVWTELEDTMYLLPLRYTIGEVVVTGVGPDLKRNMKKNHEAMLNQPIVSGLSFDFGKMLDKRYRRDRKHYKKAKELLREWDAR